jgi:hypothetical protein
MLGLETNEEITLNASWKAPEPLLLSRKASGFAHELDPNPVKTEGYVRNLAYDCL